MITIKLNFWHNLKGLVLQKKMVSKKSDNKMEHYGRKTVAGLMMKLIHKIIGM